MNILLTSAGRRAYIVDYFKKTKGIDKVFASNSVYTIALQRADGFFLSPLIYDPSYIPSIIGFCREEHITAVLSLFDIDLLVLAQYEKDFKKNGIRLILAPEAFVEICNDKYKTYEFIQSLGLNTPKTYLQVNDVKTAILKGDLTYPIIMKPRWGMASMGIYVVENEQELFFFSQKCKKDILNSYLKYESSKTKEEVIIYQEFLHGEEYGLDVLNDLDGHYVKTFAKQKISMRSGETDLGRTTNPIPFEFIARKISENSAHKGICSVDCLKKDDGSIYVIEMNCRISGHFPLAYLAGFNYPQLIVDWLQGLPTNPYLLKFEEDLYIVKDLMPVVLSKGNIPRYDGQH